VTGAALHKALMTSAANLTYRMVFLLFACCIGPVEWWLCPGIVPAL